ncbi:MAG: hypothetical protein ABI597_11815, partial [Gammaproteobacteria bacterium]
PFYQRNNVAYLGRGANTQVRPYKSKKVYTTPGIQSIDDDTHISFYGLKELLTYTPCLDHNKLVI